MKWTPMRFSQGIMRSKMTQSALISHILPLSIDFIRGNVYMSGVNNLKLIFYSNLLLCYNIFFPSGTIFLENKFAPEMLVFCSEIPIFLMGWKVATFSRNPALKTTIETKNRITLCKMTRPKKSLSKKDQFAPLPVSQVDLQTLLFDDSHLSSSSPTTSNPQEV